MKAFCSLDGSFILVIQQEQEKLHAYRWSCIALPTWIGNVCVLLDSMFTCRQLAIKHSVPLHSCSTFLTFWLLNLY